MGCAAPARCLRPGVGRGLSGGNRITLLAQFDAPREGSSVWGLQVSGGTVVLASAAPADQKPLILNRVALRMRVDTLYVAVSLDHAGNWTKENTQARRMLAGTPIPRK